VSLESVAAQLAQLQQSMDQSAEKDKPREEMMETFRPILREVMDTATDELGKLEERGWLRFLTEAAAIADEVVSSTSPRDVLDAVHAAAEAQPAGMYAMLKSARDDDVRRGMGVMLEVLRRVGGSQGSAAPSSKAERMARRLAPRRDVARPTPQREPLISLVYDAEVVCWQGDDPGFVDSWDRPAGESAAAVLQRELVVRLDDFLRATAHRFGGEPGAEQTGSQSAGGRDDPVEPASPGRKG
jgi:uncharacterized protein YjgD (DUF1641 family)